MLTKKMARLESSLRELPGALVAFSGGADSAFLAEMSHRALGVRSIALTADSPSLPRRELRAAGELARARGWRWEVVETAELHDERYASNPVDRCYFCKSALFERIAPRSAELGWPALLGTNTDDLGDYRPGQKAASERSALHPLVDTGWSKLEIREASGNLGLPTSDKPASACLASRFAYGVRVTAEGLGRVEAAEEELLARGFPVVRVRDLGDDRARIEVSSDRVGDLKRDFASITAQLISIGFREVIVDGRGYRQGALNEGVAVEITKGR